MEWKQIAIEDKDLIESYFQSQNIVVSDLTFTNLFLWHYSRSISYSISHDCLCIQTKYPNQEPFVFFPIHKQNNPNSLKQSIFEMMQHFKANQHPFSFHSLSTQDCKLLEELLPSAFEFVYQEDRSDYIYSIPELIALKGKKYHKKKNHLNRFVQSYDFIYEPLSSQNASEVLETYQKWLQTKESTQGIQNEFLGIKQALLAFEKLSYKGGLIRIEGQIIAFSFGEALNKSTIVIHIEKANTNYQGAYQAINKEFLAHQWSAYSYVNREEDLGIPGLRKAKQSYQPLYLEKKYNAYPKNP